MSENDEITIEEIDEMLAAFSCEIPETPEILRIRSEIADRRKKVASVEFKSEAWHRHRADALAYCCALIRQTSGQPAPIKYAFTPQFSEFTCEVTDILGNRWQPEADPSKLAKPIPNAIPRPSQRVWTSKMAASRNPPDRFATSRSGPESCHRACRVSARFSRRVPVG